MAAAADTLTPVLAECGGKDALLVSADADLDAAADAAAWGAMSNAGQTCVGIERVYVADAVYHTFLERLTPAGVGAAARVRSGGGVRADDLCPRRPRSWPSTWPTRWPGAGGRWWAARTSVDAAVRAAGGADRRAGGLARR